jgi:hypothetical protein
LVEGGQKGIPSRARSLSAPAEMNFGSMPNDGGNLILNSDEREKLISQYPKIRENIKKFKGSNEIINGNERFCLWIEDNDVEYMMSIPEINGRITAVKNSRLESKRLATNKLLRIGLERFGIWAFLLLQCHLCRPRTGITFLWILWIQIL